MLSFGKKRWLLARLNGFVLPLSVVAMYLTISTSTNQQSKSLRLAQEADSQLAELTLNAELINLADYALPLDNGTGSKDESVRDLARRIGLASGVVLVLPVYRGDVSVAARNLIQHCAASWERKVVGMISVAGVSIAHASTVSLANTLMLEHRSFIVPDFVFVESKQLASSTSIVSIRPRVLDLVTNLVRITESLKKA